MEREANYVAVGAFILLVMAMAVAFVLWYTDANDQRDYDVYEIYFTGSVSGLDRGSPVRYLGVDVGRVRRLTIDRRDASRIVAVADVWDALTSDRVYRKAMNSTAAREIMHSEAGVKLDADCVRALFRVIDREQEAATSPAKRTPRPSERPLPTFLAS